MVRGNRWKGMLVLGFGLGLAWPSGGAQAGPADGGAQVPVGGRIATGEACYLRLPDLPEGRYAGFGAFNPESAVLAYAGGVGRRSEAVSETQHDLFVTRLDSPTATWQSLAYSGNLGYTREADKGCREMASVDLGGGLALSVLGKDGCDHGRFDRGGKGGDLRALAVGASADRYGVRWVPGSGAQRLVGMLAEHDGKLTRLFAVHDARRERILFGLGTFDDDLASETRDEVYAARATGSQYQLVALRPTGIGPSARYGSCAAYVDDPASGLDGVLVVGGRSGGPVDTESFGEAWWLDLSERTDGHWTDISDRFSNWSDFGPRYDGACAYDRATGDFMWWAGRASSRIPDGASYSAGLWRFNASSLAGERPLTWERLAPDNLAGIPGRSLIPTLWDPLHRRILLLGGRNRDAALSDVWALYPGIDAAGCAVLDPFGSPPPAGPLEPTAAATAAPSETPTRYPTPTLTAIPAHPKPSATPPAPSTPTEPASATPRPSPAGEEGPARWAAIFLPVILTGEGNDDP